MSAADFILERLAAHGDQPSFFWRGDTYDGHWLVQQVQKDVDFLSREGIAQGSVVILKGDYSPRNISLLLALIQQRAIFAPLLPSTLAKSPSLVPLVNPAFQIDGASDGEVVIHKHTQTELHPLIRI